LIASVLVLAMSAMGRGDDDKGDAKKIEGTWQLTSAELAGKPLPADFVKSAKLKMSGGEYKLTSAEEPDAGTYVLDLKAKPRAVDIKGVDGPNKGKTFLAIYELKGDEMIVCYDLSGKSRPTEFKTKPATTLFLARYKREKP
jgi:uncharacterized protein (TIGR03067 family)